MDTLDTLPSPKERKIVHIKDVFPGIQVESADRSAGDSETNNNQNKVSNYKPKIIQAKDSSDVIFGDVSGLAEFQGSRRGRMKKEAPRAPVLIDIDVGFSEQMRQDGEESVEKCTAEEYDAPPKLFKSNRKVKDEVPQPSNKTTNASPNGSLNLDVTAFMSSFSQGLNAGKNPLFNNAQNGAHESSSGVDTDDNATPNGSYGTKTGAVPAGKVALPANKPIDKPVGNKPPQHADLEADYSDYEEDFEEDEAMLEFDDEDEQIEGTNRQIYQEYHGEDYSQYLNDDTDDIAKARRKYKRRKGKKKTAAVDPSLPDASAVVGEKTESNPAVPVNEPSAKPSSLTKTLRLKLGGLFLGQNSEKYDHNAGPSLPIFGSNIHSFTYADSKIGNTITDKEIDGSLTTRSDSSLRAESRNKNFSKRWWTKDTLSAQTMPGNSDIMLKARRSHNIESVEDEDDLYSTISDPTGNTSENGHINEGDLDLTQDFESYRKNTMYNTKGKKKRPAIWHKLSRTSQRNENIALFGANDVSNPLAQLDANEFDGNEDIDIKL